MTRKYPPQPRKSLSAEERMARHLQRLAEAEQAMREHAADQAALGGPAGAQSTGGSFVAHVRVLQH